MRSKVLSMFPFEQVDITPFQRHVTLDQAKLQKEMDRVVYPYITWADGDEAHPGDVVTCRMESADARFQREHAMITVGAGLLGKEEEPSWQGPGWAPYRLFPAGAAR